VKIWRLLLFVSGVVLLTAAVNAGPLSETELQQQLKAVAKSLRCAVCQSESVWESNAELAVQMRAIIRTRLTAGESPEQIRAYFQSRYGDFILLKPPPTGMNRLLWIGPFLFLLIGGAVLYGVLRKWVAQAEPATAVPAPPLDASSRARIDAEIQSFNNDQR
jgi:cytochrome c-type biogenesis protein CcmH